MVDGDQTYTISYTYIMPDDRVEYSDFIYYSILGTEWDTEIENFSFHMTFEKALPQSAVEEFQIYSGPEGETKNVLNVTYEVNKKEISGEADHIEPHQAITLFTNLPQGYIEGAAEVSTRLA